MLILAGADVVVAAERPAGLQSADGDQEQERHAEEPGGDETRGDRHGVTVASLWVVVCGG